MRQELREPFSCTRRRHVAGGDKHRGRPRGRLRDRLLNRHRDGRTVWTSANVSRSEPTTSKIVNAPGAGSRHIDGNASRLAAVQSPMFFHQEWFDI